MKKYVVFTAIMASLLSLNASAETNNYEIVSKCRQEISTKYKSKKDKSLPKIEAEYTSCLLKNGMDVNAALIDAIEKGITGEKAIDFLIQKGADINTKDEMGATPLILAATKSKSNIELLSLLINKGADVNAADSDGFTALMLAVKNGHEDAVKFLIEKEANINATDNSGNTALYHSMNAFMFQAYPEIMRLLVEKGADVNIIPEDGKPFLYTVITSYDPLDEAIDDVSFLIKHGANVNAVLKDGTSILQYVEKARAEKLVNILKEAGAK